MWVNANAMAAYGLAAHGAKGAALDVAGRVARAPAPHPCPPRRHTQHAPLPRTRTAIKATQ